MFFYYFRIFSKKIEKSDLSPIGNVRVNKNEIIYQLILYHYFKVNSSNQSRSGSPQSDSSENPEASDFNSSSNQQDYNHHSNYPLEQEYKPDLYQLQQHGTFNPYIQPNMLNNMRPPYYNQNDYFHQGEESYNQNLPPVGGQTAVQPSGNFSNIFQPYADCHTSSNPSVPQDNYSYLPSINQMVTPRTYYQPYY